MLMYKIKPGASQLYAPFGPKENLTTSAVTLMQDYEGRPIIGSDWKWICMEWGMSRMQGRGA